MNQKHPHEVVQLLADFAVGTFKMGWHAGVAEGGVDPPDDFATQLAINKEQAKELLILLLGREPTEPELAHVTKATRSDQTVPVIAKSFPLEEIAEAHRFMESNQHTGKIVVTTR